jgi:hypothetical protein
VRDVLIDTLNKDPSANGLSFMRAVRNPDFFLSQSTEEIRKIASNSGVAFAHHLETALKDFGKMVQTLPMVQKEKRALVNDVSRFAKLMQETTNPVTKEMGVYAKSYGDFFDKFATMMGKPPTPEQAEVYFRWRQIMDFDHMIRNQSTYATKARQGFENFSVAVKGEGEAAGIMKMSDAIEGKLVDRLPTTGEAHRVLVLDEAGNAKVLPFMEVGSKQRDKYIKDLNKQGYKFVQVWDPLDGPHRKLAEGLKGGDQPINFVAAKSFERDRLSYSQVPYREAGHAEYAAKEFIKQPVLMNVGKGRKAYAGDTTLSGHKIAPEADDFFREMEQARKLLAAKSPDLDTFIKRTMAISPEEFKKMFGKGGFDPAVPFFRAKRGETYATHADFKAQNIIDYTDSSFNPSYGTNLKFGQERGDGLFTYRKGSDNNPVWQMGMAEKLDPLGSLNRNLSDLRNMAVFQDYRVRMAENFIEQYADILNVDKTKMRGNPIWHLYNPEWSATPSAKLTAGQQVHESLLNLLGTRSTAEIHMNNALDQLTGDIYRKRGVAAAELYDTNVVMTTKNPVSFIRSTVFHAQMGMLNTVQLFLNAMTSVSIFAAAPKHATLSIRDFMTAWALRYQGDPQMIAEVARRTHGAKADEFVEMFKEYQNSGFGVVKGNYAYTDDLLNPKFIDSTLGKVLDFGAIFAREGERIPRTGAYVTAFREWKSNNVGRALDDAGRREILTRADDLSFNMTAASNANIQHGLGAIPTQMMSYVFRTMETFWTSALGSDKAKFTRPEIARIVGANMAVFGVPSGGTLAIGIWPMVESMQKYANEKGWDLNDTWQKKFFSSGVFEMFTNWALGDDWAASKRYGPNGLPTLKDISEGKYEAVLGVSGSMLKKMYDNVGPFWTKLSSAFNAEPGTDFQLTPRDFIEPFKFIATVNNIDKLYVAQTYGHYLTRAGQKISKEESPNIVATLLLGLTPKEVDAMYSRRDILADQQKAIKGLTERVQKELSLALNENDNKASDQYFKRAAAYIALMGNITPQQKGEVMQSALKNLTQEQVDQVNLRWVLSSPDAQRMQNRIQTLENEKARK